MQTSVSRRSIFALHLVEQHENGRMYTFINMILIFRDIIAIISSQGSHLMARIPELKPNAVGKPSCLLQTAQKMGRCSCGSSSGSFLIKNYKAEQNCWFELLNWLNNLQVVDNKLMGFNVGILTEFFQEVWQLEKLVCSTYLVFKMSTLEYFWMTFKFRVSNTTHCIATGI